MIRLGRRMAERNGETNKTGEGKKEENEVIRIRKMRTKGKKK